MWYLISQVIERSMGGGFENIGSHWLCNKKFVMFNMISSAALWALWKFRNDMCFQNVQWRNIGVILGKVSGLLQNWIILCPMEKRDTLNGFITGLRQLASRPERLQ
jgi:hypothetical protein